MTPLIDVDKFIDDTKINEVNLDDCFQKQSSLRAYYGSLAAQYEANASKAKMLFEIREAQVFKEIRDSMVASGVKPTEKAIENAVKTDPRWIKERSKMIDMQCQADIARALVTSLVDRRDMLIQLGADRRGESKGQLRMMAAQEEADRMVRLQTQVKALINKAN